jgi:hypothetical protein
MKKLRILLWINSRQQIEYIAELSAKNSSNEIVLALKVFFSMQALLESRGHMLTSKIIQRA